MTLDPTRLPEDLKREKYQTFRTLPGALTSLLAYGSAAVCAVVLFLFHDRLHDLSSSLGGLLLAILAFSWGGVIVIYFWRKRRFMEIAQRQGISPRQANGLWTYSEPGTD